MTDNSSTVKVTLEISQDTNLDDLMAHLYLMQNNIPNPEQDGDEVLDDFSIHEGELDPTASELPWA